VLGDADTVHAPDAVGVVGDVVVVVGVVVVVVVGVVVVVVVGVVVVVVVVVVGDVVVVVVGVVVVVVVVVAGAVEANAEREHEFHFVPLENVDGNSIRFVCEELTLLQVVEFWSRTRIVPPLPRAASQYLRPATTEVGEDAVKVFHAELTGLFVEPFVRSVPGLPQASE
jgi:hypothetical protein